MDRSQYFKLGVRVEDELPEPIGPWDTPAVISRKGRKKLEKSGDLVSILRDILLKGHVHVRGRTGCGKTQIIFLPMILDALREFVLRYKTSDGRTKSVKEKSPVFVFDNGGDRALFAATKAMAEKLGRTFRYFSLDPKKSFGFDPFQSVPEDENRIVRLSALLTEALQLEMGTGHGPAYYTARNMAQMLQIAELAVAEKKAGRQVSIRDIDAYIHEKRHQVKDAEQVRMIWRFLLQYPQLEPSKDDTDAINWKRAIEEREVIFFSTPTMGETTTARQISGLGLYTAINAVLELVDEREGQSIERPAPKPIIFVDEFQELAGRSFAQLLAQGRKHVSMVMANQTTDQLNTRDVSLADIVRDNTQTKIYFTATGKLDVEELQSYSKEDRATLKTERSGGKLIASGMKNMASESYAEYVTPLLTKNSIIDTTATTGEFFVVHQDGEGGHKEPIRTRGRYVLKEADYIGFMNTPIPDVKKVSSPRKKGAGASSKKQDARPRWAIRHAEKPDAVRLEFLEKLRNKVSELRSEERLP